MAENSPKVLLDTNILVSAVIYGGTPREILSLVLDKQIIGVTSLVLLAELVDVLRKKFKLTSGDILLIEKEIKKNFILVYPTQTVDILPNNNPDNRVLEAAVAGNCHYIITGDRELLGLKVFQGVNIVTATEFLAKMN